MNICILLHLVGFLQPRITMHGTTNIKFVIICRLILLRTRNFYNKFEDEIKHSFYLNVFMSPDYFPENHAANETV